MFEVGRLADPGVHPGFRFGVGLRRRHYEPLLAAPPLQGLDFFEVIPENFLEFGGLPRKVLREARRRVPVITHGISLSLGGPSPLDTGYLDELRELLHEFDVPWHSDHVCVSSAHGVEYHDLLPIPLSRQRLSSMASRIRQATEHLGRPFLVENPTVYTQLPGDEMSEPEFLAGLVEQSGCKLLLDLNNVWVNCRNHGGDPVAYLEALPVGCVGQYHLAGHRDGEELVVDSHGAEVCREVRDLYAVALRLHGPAWTLLERDANVPPLEELLQELAELKSEAEDVLRAPAVTISLPATGPAPEPVVGEAAAGAQALHEVVVGARAPEEVAETFGVPPAGLRLYRNFFRRHHREILATPYRVLFSLLDEESRDRITREYRLTHPMAYREINANARAFPAWLAERVQGGLEPELGEFHVELATLERARFEAYSNRREVHGDDSGSRRLNPTLAILQFRYGVADFVERWSAAIEEGRAPPLPPSEAATEPEVILVYRDPTSLHGRIARGTPRLLLAVKMLHEGRSSEEVGKLSGRGPEFAEEALQVAADVGLVLEPERRPEAQAEAADASLREGPP